MIHLHFRKPYITLYNAPLENVIITLLLIVGPLNIFFFYYRSEYIFLY